MWYAYSPPRREEHVVCVGTLETKLDWVVAEHANFVPNAAISAWLAEHAPDAEVNCRFSVVIGVGDPANDHMQFVFAKQEQADRFMQYMRDHWLSDSMAG